MRKFGAYLKDVLFGSALNIFFLVVDIVFGIFPMCWPNLAQNITTDVYCIRTCAGGIFFLSFFLANFFVYLRLTDQISYQADIRLKVEASNFYPSPGSVRSPFREVQKSSGGFSQQGLPDWAYLYATISIHNVGKEPGKLKWEFDKSKTKLPSFFDTNKIKIDSDHLPVKVDGSGFASTRDFYLNVMFTEQSSPQAFAQALKALVKSNARYRIVICYWTERLNGRATKPCTLYIRGDFKAFHQAILEHWDNYRFEDLAKAARFDEPFSSD